MSTETYLIFQEDAHYYAIPQLSILEIRSAQEMFPLPIPLAHIPGMCFFQNLLIALLDCNSYYFHMPTATPQYHIIVQYQQVIGLVADAIIGNQEIDENTWERQEMEPNIYCESQKGVCYLLPFDKVGRDHSYG